SASSAAVACFAFATSVKAPVMLERTLILGLVSLAPCLKPAAAWVVGGISAPPTYPTVPVFDSVAAIAPPTYAGAPQSFANPVTFLWNFAVYPATSMKYFVGNLSASASRIGP